jgi:integrase
MPTVADLNVPHLDAATVAKLRLSEDKKQLDWFEDLHTGRSLIFSLSHGGTRSWHVQFYEGGKPRRKKLGDYPAMSAREARKLASDFDVKGAIASNAHGTLAAVAAEYLRRYVVEKKQLRSHAEIKRCIDKYVLSPKLILANKLLANKPFGEIGRSEINMILDLVQKDATKGSRNGARQADLVLAILSKMMRWYAANHDDYVSRVVPGMNRADAVARTRILDENEIRALWGAGHGQFVSLCKMLLLTAQRLGKVRTMRWADIDIKDDTWTIPTEDPREKKHAGKLRLPRIALDIINSQPQFIGNPYIFAASRRGAGPADFSKSKRALKKLQLKPADPWTLHDLRRTAKSLMARAGVSWHISERTLGHVIKGVEGVYDRYDYDAEKADALNRLAALIETIVAEPSRAAA